jgi:predicted RND superfamily exporter protein
MTGKAGKISLIIFLLISAASVYYVTQLKFAFDFEQFFPQGDPELEFFRDFVEEFEADDNFLIVAVHDDEGVFQQDFLEKFHALTLAARGLESVIQTQSLTTFTYPLKTPFAITTLPVIDIGKPERYEKNKARIMADERFVYNLISPDAKSMCILLKTKPAIQLEAADKLVVDLQHLVEPYGFDSYHMLGRAYFQKELVAMQKREIIFSAVVSGFLVMLIMFLIYRRFYGIAIALVSIGLGMLVFMGLLGFLGRELSAISALYPVLMIIVGTSDVIHIMSKYIDELKKGKTKKAAIKVTIREIGLATLMTSLTTAVGFGSLITSKVFPIRDFGLNAAMGVMVAYLTVIFFTSVLLAMMDRDQLIKEGKRLEFWPRLMQWFYDVTKMHPRRVSVGALAVLGLTLYGISNITTNYSIINNMPRGKKITSDFKFFEENFAGFRPMDIAVIAKDSLKVTDYKVAKAIDAVEEHLHEYPPLRAITSLSTVYKSINSMYNGNKASAFTFPKDERTFDKYQRMVDKLPQNQFNVLVNRDGDKARISSRILDVGADTIKQIGKDIDQWIVANTDTSQVEFIRTGTGLIIDKNAEYIRSSLLYGLAGAIFIVAILMTVLFRDWRLIIISMVPNIFPLLLAGAFLGFFGIELEAGISIVFAVIFGIAVDDTIHFLSKFKLMMRKGVSIDKAIHTTFMETGKAICITSVILFFGFMVMLFSIHPPSVVIGFLISLTLMSALLSDLFLMPILIRGLYPKEPDA